jgi:thioredoxin reductase (NADPH)
MMEVTEAGALMLSEQVTAIVEDEGGWTVTTTEGSHYARAVVVASGTSLKRLGVPGEEKFEYKGVSRCADCDGPVYRGKDVVVAGGGASALQEARILAGFCRHVYLLNRGSQFTAQPHLIEAIGGCGNVTVRHLTEVEALLGNELLEKVQIRDLAEDTVSEIACSGFFGFVGLSPTTEFIPASVLRDPDGFLVTDGSFTAGKRLFAAGAVRSGCGGMLQHAVAEGLAAADGVIKMLNEIG